MEVQPSSTSPTMKSNGVEHILPSPLFFIIIQLRGDNIDDSMTDMVAQLPPLNIFFNSRDTLVSLFFIVILRVAMLVSDATSISL